MSYREKIFLPELEMAVEFEEDEIKLDIPMEGIATKGGWKITPHMPPVVWELNIYQISSFWIIDFLLSNCYRS